MIVKTPDYYKEFSCAAENCKFNCCKSGWDVIIDKGSLDFYQNTSGVFKEKFNKTIKKDKKEYRFEAVNGVCPFLNRDKLCDIQCEFGEERLCDTCKIYPRFIYEYGPLREKGISLSCPEATKLIIQKQEPVSFETVQTDEKVSKYNNISPELFVHLTKARDSAIRICQNRNFSVSVRASLLLKFAKKLQKSIDSDGYEKINNLIEKYGSDEFLAKKSVQLKPDFSSDENIMFFFNTFLNLEHLPPLKEHINEICSNLDSVTSSNCFEDFSIQYEQLLTYFIYKYFLDALYDGDVLSNVKFSIVSLIMIDKLNSLFDYDLSDIICMYSRDIEHSDKNLKALRKSLKHKKQFKCKNILLCL